jgi:hypothetical protein
MKLGRPNYLSFVKAALIVAAVATSLSLIVLRLPGISDSVRYEIVGILVLFPGALIFMPMIHNIHNFWRGYLVFGGAINWFLYTWWVWALMEKRRKRELQRNKPSGSTIPPG